MTNLPMFPLGSVLFPSMPLQLRVFEERYLVMLSRILQSEPAEFGVVLIERGQEVGGGEQRFTVGTVAQIVELNTTEGFVSLVAVGQRRILVEEWLAEDPHPAASVRTMPDLEWSDDLAELRDEAEQVVRRALARASEYGEQLWLADLTLSDDPGASIWQLAGIAPIGPIDQIDLLRSTSFLQLLTLLIEHTTGAEETFGDPWVE